MGGCSMGRLGAGKRGEVEGSGKTGIGGAGATELGVR